MEKISLLIAKATAERAARTDKGSAFGEIVREFQDLAFGCAYAVLNDFHLAEDAAQEAFITAWRHLDQLTTPEAFPGWFKRIVLTQCNRLTRAKRLPTVLLENITDVPARDADPHAAYEGKERQQRVLAAVKALPEHERMVITLFYINDYSQNEIAAFLEAPLTTVKKRLHSARRKLQEMLDMVRETLQEQRPSRNERFAETVAAFKEALESFVARIKQDRYVIAAILYGSLSHDTVWRKSDIDIILIGKDEKAAKEFALVENGINIHAALVPRSKFKQSLEGALQGSFAHSSFALSTLLYTTDDTIRAYYDNVRSIGARDRQLQLMAAGSMALGPLAKAEKWLLTRNDVAYSFVWIMYTLRSLAEIEVLLHGELTSREVLPHALKLNPDFFGKVYADFIQQPKDVAAIQRVLDLINAYLDSKINIMFGPVLLYLQQEGGIRTVSEIELYFGKQVQSPCYIGGICEWLADKGIIQKVPSPLRLTHKSQVTVDEAAYYYDGASAKPSVLRIANRQTQEY